MPILTPDTSAAEDFSQPIPPGTYKARIVSVEAGRSKAGNAKIMPKFELTVDGKKRTRTAHLVVSGEGSMGFDQLLRACHMADLADIYRDKSATNKPPFDTDTLIGQELQVVIEEQLYKPDTGPEQKRDQIVGFLAD
jgi:hypothetical protein